MCSYIDHFHRMYDRPTLNELQILKKRDRHAISPYYVETIELVIRPAERRVCGK